MTKTATLPCEMPRAWRSDSSLGFPRISARISGAASNLNFPSVVFVSEDDPVRTVRTGLYTRHRIRVCYAPSVRRVHTREKGRERPSGGRLLLAARASEVCPYEKCGRREPAYASETCIDHASS